MTQQSPCVCFACVCARVYVCVCHTYTVNRDMTQQLPKPLCVRYKLSVTHELGVASCVGSGGGGGGRWRERGGRKDDAGEGSDVRLRVVCTF